MNIEDLFHSLHSHIVAIPADLYGAVFQLNVTGASSGIFQLKIKDHRFVLQKGAIDRADCIVTVHEDILSQIVARSLNPSVAYVTGKIKIRGNTSLLRKLLALWQ